MPSVYEVITNRIIEQLEKGTAPWHKPWAAPGLAGMPQNFISKKSYRGINLWLLSATGYSSPAFLTFKQAAGLGGKVKTGEKGWPVIFWKFGQDDSTDKSWAFCRYYTVFNVSQCEGLQLPISPAPAGPEVPAIEVCETIVESWANRPPINHGGDRACYSPSRDVVTMPERNSFCSPEEYYSTLFHELTHSTGHDKRLKRPGVTDICPFGTTNYSREELVAEMGAAFLCGFAGIENKTIDNSAAYIASWLKRLKDDSKLVITAAQQAQKACDSILGSRPAVELDDSAPVVTLPEASLVFTAPKVDAPAQYSLF